MKTIFIPVGYGETGFVRCFGGVCIEVAVIFEFGVYYFVERIDDKTMWCVVFVEFGKFCVGFYVIHVPWRNCWERFFWFYVADVEGYLFEDVVKLYINRFKEVFMIGF